MNLSQWLEYQQSIHSKPVDLGLDRVRPVAERLGLAAPAPRVITVGGTNGKGSTVAFVDAIARAAGLRTGVYSSPHLRRYNERVQIDGESVSDEALVQAFEAIEAARGDTPLTYYEFGTLAALWLFSREALDLVVLEVGLGGRLDAVNLVDADVAIITTIALDHTELLGNDRESIAVEKAGIFRAGKPAVIAELDPPDSLLREAERVGSPVFRAGRNYHFQAGASDWQWKDDRISLTLPLPQLRAPVQIGNAAAAIAALRAVVPAIKLDETSVAEGVAAANLPGRMQVIPGPVEIVLDVAHNPQSVQQLALWLRQNRVRGSTLAVFGALADKDVANAVATLMAQVDLWHLGGLPDVGARGQTVEALWQQVGVLLSRSLAVRHATIAEALAEARRTAQAGDRIVVFGSFYTVAEALDVLDGD